MKYLLDTHVFIWSLEENKKLKNSIKKILIDPENQIFVSVIAGIEISTKTRSGKLRLKTTIKEMFEISGFELLDVNFHHILAYDKLSLHPNHKDPFDRILISQAKAENLTLITSDPKMWKYQVPVIKA